MTRTRRLALSSPVILCLAILACSATAHAQNEWWDSNYDYSYYDNAWWQDEWGAAGYYAEEWYDNDWWGDSEFEKDMDIDWDDLGDDWDVSGNYADQTWLDW